MEIRTLYKYERENGGVTVSPQIPDPGVQYIEMYRVIASKGTLVTQDGTNKYSVVDTEDNSGWYEIEDETILNHIE